MRKDFDGENGTVQATRPSLASSTNSSWREVAVPPEPAAVIQRHRNWKKEGVQGVIQRHRNWKKEGVQGLPSHEKTWVGQTKNLVLIKR
jgi:hypothetical protein